MLMICLSPHVYVHIKVLSVLPDNLLNAERIKYTVRYFQNMVKQQTLMEKTGPMTSLETVNLINMKIFFRSGFFLLLRRGKVDKCRYMLGNWVKTAYSVPIARLVFWLCLGQLIFFIVTHMMLWFFFLTKTVPVTQ